MGFYDIFNGDADGLCALQQLRLAEPRDAVLVTGTKRDTALLARISPAAGDSLTVLDIPVDRNTKALALALDAGARVSWFDHHFCERLPSAPGFDGHFDFGPDICTSLIVDRYLGGQHRAWAVVGAFGDNLGQAATAAAISIGLEPAAIAVLKCLGEALNYNAYADDVEDLMFHPADLHRRMLAWDDPLRFAAGDDSVPRLQQMRADDLARALGVAPALDTALASAVVLPDAPWSRRVGGTLANHLAQTEPAAVHAVLAPSGEGFTVSLRSSPGHRTGAHAIAREFGGGGRAVAAGINAMPASEIPRLLRVLREV